MPAKVSEAKKRSVVGYRKKKGLCELCGCVKDGAEHVCYENYVKADMTDVELRKEDVVEIHGVAKEEVVSSLEELAENETNVMPELDARIKTIISYRRRKQLCIRCGSVDVNVDHKCEEDYTEADRRSEEEKKADPRTVITPKEKMPTIEEKQQIDEVNKAFTKKHPDEFFRMQKTAEIQSQRKFILIDLNRSVNGQKFSVDYIKFLTSKHKNMIIYAIGDIDSIYSYKESQDLGKIANFCSIRNILDQNIVNHLHGCQRFFGFPSKYMTYSMCYNIPCTAFFDNSDNYNVPCDIVDIKDGEDVNRQLVAINVTSWKV